MPGRGPQTFKKRQKEQERKERQMEKMARRLQRKNEKPSEESPVEDSDGIAIHGEGDEPDEPLAPSSEAAILSEK